MDVLILHDRLPAEARPDEADVLAQAAFVEEGLRGLGHTTRRYGTDLDLEALRRHLEQQRPDLVFNLCESPAGSGAHIHLPLAAIETLRIPITGADSVAMMLTSNKLTTKRMLALAKIPTAEWFDREALLADGPLRAKTYIIKSVWEHGSLGLDEDSVIETSSREVLRSELERRLPAIGGEGFVEGYVEGREFNLSILAGPEGPKVQPIAEILFPGYAPGRRRVVGYRAKWDEGSDAYHGTPRSFDFPAEDATLLKTLSELALGCWQLFALKGYARVDFRVDEAGQPFVLEVNANPCISPDAGFLAAAERGGVAPASVVARIVADAFSASISRRENA